jgi:hypothetical protein
MMSLSILCVGAKGQQMLVGRSGGGGMEPKKLTKRWASCDIIPSKKYFILVYKKCAK